MLYLVLRYALVSVLLDVTYEEIAKTNDSQKYYLKWYGALVVTAESFMLQRTSIA